jgi:histidinol-phosphatase (PHP family)
MLGGGESQLTGAHLRYPPARARYNRLMAARVVYETHTHTPLCRHAEGEPEEYAAIADKRGLAGLMVTCHNPMPQSYGHSGRMTEAQLGEYLEMIERCAATFQGRIDVRVGMECDYYPGYEAYVEKQIQSLPLHYVIGSVHPHLAIWRRRFAMDGPRHTQIHYFDQIAAAAETGLFDCISHPDLIKNMTPEDWSFEALVDIVDACLDRVSTAGVAMELNTSGLLKHIPEMNPTPAMLRMMRQRNIPVVIGADAHVPDRVADHFEDALELLHQAGYTHASYFLNRTRHEISLADARASLRRAGS